MLECKPEDVKVTASPMIGVEMFPLFDQMQLQLGDAMNPAAVHTLLQLPIDPVVYWVEIRTVNWPKSWSNEVSCFTD